MPGPGQRGSRSTKRCHGESKMTDRNPDDNAGQRSDLGPSDCKRPDRKAVSCEDDRVSCWHVIFSADCNLRCSYCYTGHGRFGQLVDGMDLSTLESWLDLALELALEGGELQFEFGGGETFLRFDDFLNATDRIVARARSKRVRPRIHVTTNGTQLDDLRLGALAARSIDLTFSIDGPAHHHNRNRLDRHGRTTHGRALTAFLGYRRLAEESGGRFSCDLQSVLTDGVRLTEIIEYWLAHDVQLFTCVVELPSTFLHHDGTASWRRRQQVYLEDLERFAMATARRLQVPTFLSDYCGPGNLYQMWRSLFLDQETAPCAAGSGFMAVGADGTLYPCEAFVGKQNWSVGSVFDGIDETALESFRQQYARALAACIACPHAPACPKSCFGAAPDAGVEAGFLQGCDFAISLSTIAQNSFAMLEGSEGPAHG